MTIGAGDGTAENASVDTTAEAAETNAAAEAQARVDGIRSRIAKEEANLAGLQEALAAAIAELKD